MRAASVLALLALLGAGCGGDDDDSGVAGAEATVKDQLRAIDENRPDDFCATLTAEYGRTFARQIASATGTELKDCVAAFRKARSLSDSPTFEGRALAGQRIDELDLKTSVVEKGGESTATVKGPAGVASYELVRQDGEWKVDRAKSN